MAKLAIMSVYHALLEAGASEDKARNAAEDIANYDDRLSGIERKIDQLEMRMDARFTLLQWMLGAVIVLLVAVVARLFVPIT